MITASHNPECDNGVKLVDPMGEMMAQDWEGYATQLANAEDETVLDAILSIISQNEIDQSVVGKVVIGRDTRYLFFSIW